MNQRIKVIISLTGHLPVAAGYLQMLETRSLSIRSVLHEASSSMEHEVWENEPELYCDDSPFQSVTVMMKLIRKRHWISCKKDNSCSLCQ